MLTSVKFVYNTDKYSTNKWQ